MINSYKSMHIYSLIMVRYMDQCRITAGLLTLTALPILTSNVSHVVTLIHYNSVTVCTDV